MFKRSLQFIKNHIYRPTWVEINRSAFKSNLKSIFSCLKPGTDLLAVVKANAYGHMSAPLSKLALQCGSAALGVSSIEEGIELRESGIKSKILILGSMFPLENLEIAARHNLIPTISSLHSLGELMKTGRKLKKRLPFHLKVDTGMGRIGVTPETATAVIYETKNSREVRLDGIYTHFSVACSDLDYTRMQLKKFLFVIDYTKNAGLNFIAHAANSSALLRLKESHLDMVRPGISLYGLLPFNGADKKVSLKPVLSWKTKVVFLKRVPKKTSISYGRTFITKHTSTIATLPVGYADGFRRNLSNKASVLIQGRRCPVIGRVTMDMIMVDVTNVPSISIGDEVVLIGCQGNNLIRAEEMASLAGTINYEITCGIASRVPRILVNDY